MPKPYYEDTKAGITIYHGDCREILPQLPKVDLVLTDPPYGILQKGSAHSRRFNGNIGRGDVHWDVAPTPEQLRSIIQIGSVAMIWGGNNFDLGPTFGWVVWDKQNDGLNFGECEYCWTNIKFAPRLHRERCVNIDNAREHPTQKPKNLMIHCIQIAGEPQTILDPFMGSGTTLRAAKDLGRKAIGIEIEEKYCETLSNDWRKRCFRYEMQQRWFRNDLAWPLLLDLRKVQIASHQGGFKCRINGGNRKRSF